MSGKLNLNNHFKNGEIDLSLSEIKEVPVKELAQFKKANSLDLSNNKISNIGKNFPTSLSFIVKLNLSKNSLKSLPENFGELVNLKQLDLYNNKLQNFPLSFGSLKKLEWLDVKGNPLAPKVAQITGPCGNKKQCEEAARSTVKAYAAMQKEVEAEKKAKVAEQKKKEKGEKAAAAAAQQTSNNKQEDKSKKNKNKENNKNVANNNSAPSSKSEKNKQKVQQQNGKQAVVQEKKTNKKVKNDKKNAQPKSFFGKVLSFILSIFKLIFVSSLLSVGVLFVLSLLDENKFKSIMTQLTSKSQNYISRDVHNNIVKYTLMSGKNLKHFGNYILASLSDFYVYISTDEKIQAYKDNVKDYIHMTYIRVSQLVDSYLHPAASATQRSS